MPMPRDEQHRQRQHEWYLRNKDLVRVRSKATYNKLSPEERRAHTNENRRKLRKKVVDLLGGKCVNCGCTTYEVLEINHINGAGKKRERGSLLRNILAGKRDTSDLEITCSMCNTLHWVKVLRGVPGNWEITWTP